MPVPLAQRPPGRTKVYSEAKGPHPQGSPRMLRPLKGEGEAQRSLGVDVTSGNIGRVPRGMQRPLEGEGTAQRC